MRKITKKNINKIQIIKAMRQKSLGLKNMSKSLKMPLSISKNLGKWKVFIRIIYST